MSFAPIDGPIRVVAVVNIPGHYLAINRMGHFLASGSRGPLEQMAQAWNDEHADGKNGPVKVLPAQVTACPSCGYPKESEDQAKCLTCLNPPLPTEEEEVKQKGQEMQEWF